MVTTCGPISWQALCTGCAIDVGLDAWCSGHAAEGAEHLAWLRRLPPDADDVALLWWLATGEIRPETASVTIPASVARLLPPNE